MTPDQAAESTAGCGQHDGCITCGDVAIPMTVVETRGLDAICESPEGTRESIGVELVAPVRPGDKVLAHGGFAIARLEAAP